MSGSTETGFTVCFRGTLIGFPIWIYKGTEMKQIQEDYDMDSPKEYGKTRSQHISTISPVYVDVGTGQTIDLVL